MNDIDTSDTPEFVEPRDLKPDIQSDEPGETVAEDSESSETAVWSRFGSEPLPALPKMAAVHRAFKAAMEFGLPEGFASALSNAAVDPAGLRTALNSPTKISVAGGVIEAIDVDLYVPGLVPLPTNNRTMDMRVYPSGGAPNHLGPLAGPRSLHGTSSELWIEARTVPHVLDEAKRAQDYILQKNPLKDSVAARGIVMPVTVVYFELRHRDGQPAMPLLGTADGSSRVTGAQAQLNLTDPRTTHYDFPTNHDTYRRFVDGISAPDISSVSKTVAKRLRGQRNALITPARVFLRFTPDDRQSYDYARAVAAYVGMLHVDPPRPWTPTGKMEAMAEAVLEVLRSARVLTETEHDYLAGLLTPEAAEEADMPTLRDEQAAYTLATLLRPDLRELVDRGIMDVTAKKSVTPPRRCDVAAELALRPTRSAAVPLPAGDPARERATAMRAAYLRTTHLAQYAKYQWSVTGRSPDELLEGALAELGRPEAEQESPYAWRNRLELAALAQYHLTAYGALKRDPMGGSNADSDRRSPYEVLGLMLGDQRGLRLLRQAVVDGRAGVAPRLVDADGQIVHGTVDASGDVTEDDGAPPVSVSDRWLRYDGYPAGGRAIRPVSIGPETPTMTVARLQRAVLDLVDQLARRVDELDAIELTSGGNFLEQRGWPASDTKSAVEMLVEAQSKLGYWSQVASRQAAHLERQPPGDSDDSDEATLIADADDWDAEH
jgi:hypothetical protein